MPPAVPENSSSDVPSRPLTGPLTVWTNHALPDTEARRLRDALTTLGKHRLVTPDTTQASNLIAAASDPAARAADVCFGQPAVEDLLHPENRNRFVQLTTAGYTRYDRDDLRRTLKTRGVPLCNASAVYDEPCAQHALAMILAFARQLPRAWQDGRRRLWRASDLRSGSRRLGGQRVLILGYGAIAERLTPYLQALGMTVSGVRRTPRGDEGAEILNERAADMRLGEFDHVVNILPASRSTAGYMNATRFAGMTPTAYYYSIGRGDTTRQDALREALLNGRLAGAYLDVTDPEPLPAGDPLWQTPNCHITPHTAGGSEDEPGQLVDLLLDNLSRFLQGTTLQGRVMG